MPAKLFGGGIGGRGFRKRTFFELGTLDFRLRSGLDFSSHVMLLDCLIVDLSAEELMLSDLPKRILLCVDLSVEVEPIFEQ